MDYTTLAIPTKGSALQSAHKHTNLLLFVFDAMLTHCSINLEDKVGNTVLWFTPIGWNIPLYIKKELGGRSSRAMDQSKSSFEGKGFTSIFCCCDQGLSVSNGLGSSRSGLGALCVAVVR